MDEPGKNFLVKHEKSLGIWEYWSSTTNKNLILGSFTYNMPECKLQRHDWHNVWLAGWLLMYWNVRKLNEWANDTKNKLALSKVTTTSLKLWLKLLKSTNPTEKAIFNSQRWYYPWRSYHANIWGLKYANVKKYYHLVKSWMSMFMVLIFKLLLVTAISWRQNILEYVLEHDL